MKTRFVVVISVLGLLLTAVQASGSPYQIIGTVTSQTGELIRTETSVSGGPHPLDSFKMIRLVKDISTKRLKGSIFLLPPLETGFSFYEQRDESGGVGTSIAEFFALRNFDVYGYSQRFEGIPAGTCEAGVVDCSVMGSWDLESMVGDVQFIRSQIEVLHPGTKIVVGGFSLGAILAIAVVNAHPDAYDGIFVWEGMLFSSDPGVQALNQGYCSVLEAQLAAGLVFDGVGINVLRKVAQHAELAPTGLTPIPMFPSFLTNHEALVVILSVHTPGPITMPVPNFIQINGSLTKDRFFFASEPRIFENIGRSNSYAPVGLARDVSCSLAGLDDRHIQNLGSFTGPVLMIGGTRGFGAFMQDQLSLFGSSDTTFLLEADFGHKDHFMTVKHPKFVELPMLRWIRGVFRR